MGTLAGALSHPHPPHVTESMDSTSSPGPSSPCALRAMLADGWRAVRHLSPGKRLLLALLFLLCLSFLPFGRTSPGAHLASEPGNPVHNQPARLGGSIWKPLAADSDAGHLFRHRIGLDFFCIYEAGALVLQGRDPFQVNRMTGVLWGQETGEGGGRLSPTRAPWVTAFHYTPLAALLLGAPLAVLPPWVAYGVWVLFCQGLLAVNFLLCAGRAPRHVLLLGLLWFAWFPVAVELYMGQFTLFLSSLILYTALALERGAPSAALWWGATIALKVYTAAMLPLLVLWRRGIGAAAALLIVGGTTLGYFALVPDSGRHFSERGLEGRVLLAPRQPYAGAQGLQEGINSIVWTLSGRAFGESYRRPSTPGSYEVALRASLLLLFAAYAALLLWAVWASRHGFHAGAFGLFWALWMVAFGDCWEHHLTLAQGLCAWYLITGVIDPRTAAAVWLSIGAPSLWFLFSRTVSVEAGLVDSISGLSYFLHRPVGILLLILAGARSLIPREE